MPLFSSIFGDSSSRTLKRYMPWVAKINDLESEYQALSDTELAEKTPAFKARLESGESMDSLLPEAFAVVREASRRLSGERHYDVQLLGGIALHKGNIAEMRTGEGKTLVATLPAYLNALSGRGVHVVTVNDYLARRDAVWMGQIYAFLGLSVGVVNTDGAYLYDNTAHTEDSKEDEIRDELGSFKVVYDFLRPATKREAYAADITYGTNNEFGFDHLRDNIEYEVEHLRQRGYHFAIVDEIDSILIDEARTPLIISAPAEESEDLYGQFAILAKQLTEHDHFEKDEKLRAVTLTDAGIEKAEQLLGIENLYTEGGIKLVHHLENAVRAKALFQLDKQYVVRDNSIVIVDEFTGRLQPGRRWSEGLHQAIEAKEGVSVQRESRTFASITFQNYFRMYEKLSGMTGTADTSAEEFQTVYNLEVITTPTNRPIARKDYDDLIYKSEEAKVRAVAEKVKELHENGQPVLIGTVSIEKNEQLSLYLTQAGVPHEILNAKNHEREGEIIAQAGAPGKVTIATNMAGRGVDIKLGGNPSESGAPEKVKESGGLFVLGTERHEARRIDNQLRGRAGRQGDPGGTQFFVSLDDDLMRVFGNNDLIRMIMDKLPDDAPIQHKRISKSLETAQKRIEGFNFDSRKHILAYDNVLNHQRQAIYTKRNRALKGTHEELGVLLSEITEEQPELRTLLEERKTQMGEESFYPAVRRLILQIIDSKWVDHLESMDHLRSSVNLRAYGQRDPLIEYRKEGLRLFSGLQSVVDEEIVRLLPSVGGVTQSTPSSVLRSMNTNTLRFTSASSNAEAPGKVQEKKPGRNDTVILSNGEEEREMKYKKAEPLLESGEWKIKEK